MCSNQWELQYAVRFLIMQDSIEQNSNKNNSTIDQIIRINQLKITKLFSLVKFEFT